MNTDKEFKIWMDGWMMRIMMRFDRLDKLMEGKNSGRTMVDGELLYDNQDVCQLLRISKRTLQRYRSSGELPFQMIRHKSYYKESDVEAFIQANFSKWTKRMEDTDDDEESESPDDDNDTGDNPEDTSCP